ncbi:MAG: hypothetical protein AABZ79_05385 [Pseudomonadota bacterium]|jgi:hypothetical protein|uniref:Reverse transcriptase domain-containing protein n=1 Tax=Cupriavidus metallidurans TaxID=119219 RepID=A0A482IVD3_9BURK|nr:MULTISPECIES: hypothetical protein [Cupriavidus]QBP11427.1 hypothetical protein DDF84_017595 [Cupriavidus metallidurans]
MAKIVSRILAHPQPDPVETGEAEASSHVLPLDYRRWRRRAVARRTSLLNVLRVFTPATGPLRTRSLVENVGRYLASKDMRLLALRRAMSRDSGENPEWEDAFYARWLEYRDGARSMDELNPFKPLREPCLVYDERKRSGGKRRLWKFGTCMTARQLLVSEALKAIYARRVWSQMIFSGGLPVGVADIKEALRNPDLTHYAIVDVAAFFDNVDLQGATQLLPLDRKVLENTLCVSPPSDARVGMNRYARVCVSEVLDVNGRLALPQGAASSPQIAYGLLDQALPVRCLEHSFPYADDLLFLGKSEVDVAAKVSLYEENLVGHPAGPLHLRRVSDGQIMENGSFEFVGLMFDVQDSDRDGLRTVRVEVPMRKRLEFRDRLQESVARDVAKEDSLFSRTREYLAGFLSGVPTDDHEDLVKTACEIAQANGLQASPLISAAARFLTDSEIGRLSARFVVRQPS